MKNSNVIKAIRVIVFAIFFLMLLQIIIVECVDILKIRSILIKIAYIACFLLVAILTQMPQFEVKRMTILDFLSIVIFIGLMTYFRKELSSSTKIYTAFQGNNIYSSAYSEGDSDNGYDDMESILEDKIENRKKTATPSNPHELEEIYRVQVEEKIFVYFKEDEIKIVEYDFFMQDDLYYSSGVKSLFYDGIGGMGSNASYTTEETIRKDIANTMWRGVGSDEVSAPAWGVSTDENIFSMTINSENVDDVILINEKDGKKYYFWITTNVKGIETIDDVKAAEIEMNSLQ